MKASEQKRLIEELEYHSRRMNRDDREAFEMLSKRQRDDEDLDHLSEEKLLELHERYETKKTKKDAEDIWKKLISGGKSR